MDKDIEKIFQDKKVLDYSQKVHENWRKDSEMVFFTKEFVSKKLTNDLGIKIQNEFKKLDLENLDIDKLREVYNKIEKENKISFKDILEKDGSKFNQFTKVNIDLIASKMDSKLITTLEVLPSVMKDILDLINKEKDPKALDNIIKNANKTLNKEIEVVKDNDRFLFKVKSENLYVSLENDKPVYYANKNEDFRKLSVEQKAKYEMEYNTYKEILDKQISENKILSKDEIINISHQNTKDYLKLYYPEIVEKSKDYQANTLGVNASEAIKNSYIKNYENSEKIILQEHKLGKNVLETLNKLAIKDDSVENKVAQLNGR